MSRGFTLVELLAATALAVSLMAGAMGVVASIRADVAEQHDAARNEIAPTRALIALIHRDLLHARVMKQYGGKIELIGYAELDRGSHRPMKIEYFVQRLADRNWLMRRRTRLDELTNKNHRTELAAADVAGIALHPIGRMTDDDKDMPDRLRLIVTPDGGAAGIDTVIDLR